MAENVIKKLSEDFVHCAICTEPFNEPKVLPCLHSFCFPCLRRWAQNHHGQQFPCPTCRFSVDLPSTGVHGLPINFFLVSLMERLEEVGRLSKQYQDKNNCSICRNAITNIFCLDCKMHICDGCKETHDRLSRSIDHPMIPSEKLSDERFLQGVMSAQAPFCNTHKKEKVRYYCTQCSQLACQVCVTVSHQGHQSLEEIESRVTSTKAQLETLLEQSKTYVNVVLDKSKETKRATEKIRKQISGLICKVDARYEDILAKLQSDRQKLRATLDRIENKKISKLNAIDEEILKWHMTMENVQKMTRTILEQENPWEILEMERGIVESFERVRSNKDRVAMLSIPAGVRQDFLTAKLTVVDENVATKSATSYVCQNFMQTAVLQMKSKSQLANDVLQLKKELRALEWKASLVEEYFSEVNVLGLLKP